MEKSNKSVDLSPISLKNTELYFFSVFKIVFRWEAETKMFITPNWFHQYDLSFKIDSHLSFVSNSDGRF